TPRPAPAQAARPFPGARTRRPRSGQSSLPLPRPRAAARARGPRVPRRPPVGTRRPPAARDRKSTRLNSSHGSISYADFCLQKKNPTPHYVIPTSIEHVRQTNLLFQPPLAVKPQEVAAATVEVLPKSKLKAKSILYELLHAD